MKLIFIKEQKGLLTSPEPKNPSLLDEIFADVSNYHNDMKAYSEWLSTKIEIPEGHLQFFKDREEINEEEGRFSVGGVEFEIKKEVIGGRSVKSAEGIPYDYETYFKMVAIPISNQESITINENTGDEVEQGNKHWYEIKDLMISAMEKNVTPEDWVNLCKGLGYSVTRKQKQK